MVSSSLDKSIKKALAKDMSSSTAMSSAAITSSSAIIDNSSSLNNNNINNNSAMSLPPEEKIDILFPRCKPRVEYQSSMEIQNSSSDLISITSPSSSTLHNNSTTTAAYNNNLTQVSNSKQMKLLSSPDHKKQQQHQFSKMSTMVNKHESNDNYVETNPFRISSNNRFFYAQQQQQQSNDSLFNNNNNSAATSSAMHHYHYQPSSGYHHTYQHYLEPDEIEHNPYAMDVPPIQNSSSLATTTINTIPSSILKTTPPDTPPALQPCTTPVDSSPLGSSRNLWDLSPIKIKSSTPTRIKAQSPTSHYTRPHRGSYKKLLASPVPIEEDLEMGHYYYNKKTYYQAPQTDSDSNEPVTFNDVHEVEKIKPKSAYFNSNSSKSKPSVGNNKMKNSESSDVIYAEVRKKDERKMVKSKSGSGIMGECSLK